MAKDFVIFWSFALVGLLVLAFWFEGKVNDEKRAFDEVVIAALTEDLDRNQTSCLEMGGRVEATTVGPWICRGQDGLLSSISRMTREEIREEIARKKEAYREKHGVAYATP